SIVVHGAKYVNSSKSKMGRSWGCPALQSSLSTRIIKEIKEGSLMYAWAGE
ncbi:MAG: murein L,D-transpeptidase catalytic domain family protein, partial [Proteobacteria bacterium]|nr:murein L,D-transpeptidase catalytic domain family protein [Pseudomonadota bacterium]